MSTAIDRLPEVPGAAAITPVVAPATSALPDGTAAVAVHQALSWYPVYRGTGVAVSEAIAEQAIAHNATLPTEVQTAVRLKIRTDGVGVRYAKRRDAAGNWELCFSSLDPWLSDIVEYLPTDETAAHHWRLMIADTDVVLTWTGAWDDRPPTADLWTTKPWHRNTFPV